MIDDIFNHVLMILISVRYESIYFLNSQKDLPLEIDLRVQECTDFKKIRACSQKRISHLTANTNPWCCFHNM
jgi:hypothetical protein